jgi:hypothetical protein
MMWDMQDEKEEKLQAYPGVNHAKTKVKRV